MPKDASSIAGYLAPILKEISSSRKVENWDKLILFFSSRCFHYSDSHQKFELASRINGIMESSLKKTSWSLKYLQSANSMSGTSLLRALEEFVNTVLAGQSPPDSHPFFFGAALVTFHNKCDHMRPIAIGCTLKRLAAKCAVMKVKQRMKSLLIPHQLGFGVKHGAEAIVHSARIFLDELQPSEIMIKVVYKDAFNSVFHTGVIAAVEEYAPELLPFVNSLLSIQSCYFHDDKVVRSAKSLPERDPLAPFLFCLATKKITTDLKCDLKVFYLGIGILGGQIQDVLTDLESVKKRAKELGLELDYEKCKLICHNPVTLKRTLPGVDFTELNLVKKQDPHTLLEV